MWSMSPSHDEIIYEVDIYCLNMIKSQHQDIRVLIPNSTIAKLKINDIGFISSTWHFVSITSNPNKVVFLFLMDRLFQSRILYLLENVSRAREVKNNNMLPCFITITKHGCSVYTLPFVHQETGTSRLSHYLVHMYNQL